MNIEELIKLADMLDSNGESDAAGEIDDLIKAAGPEVLPEDPTEEDTVLTEPEPALPGEYDESESETMTMEPASEEPSELNQDSLRQAMDSFLESPRRFENVHRLKQMIDEYVLQAVPKEASVAGAFQKLAGMADELDAAGYREAADKIDGFLSKHASDANDGISKQAIGSDQDKRYDDRYHHSLLVREPKRDDERVDREGGNIPEPGPMSLSGRNCPDHIGAQLSRVREGVYQCSMTGHMLDWTNGWDDSDGNKHGGGSISNQTGFESDMGVGHRVFDTRSTALNKIH